MKLRMITVISACTALLATISIGSAQAPATDNEGGAKHRHHKWGNRLDQMTKTLDLTPEQQAKIRPILDQTKSQIATAREESRQRMKAIRDNVRLQIRPLLSQAQQQKWDAVQRAREDLRKARHAMREAASREVAASQ
jgi:protein CpxP